MRPRRPHLLLGLLVGGLPVLTACSGTASPDEDAVSPVTTAASPTGGTSDRAAQPPDDASNGTTDPAPHTSDPSSPNPPQTDAAQTGAPSTTGTTGTSGTSDAQAGPRRDGPVDVLLVGSDSRDPGSETGRADTIVLVHLPADRSSLGLISFSRDMWVSIPGSGEDKINAALPIGGTALLTETVSELLGGLDVDYTVQVSMDALPGITGWLDGIEVVNQHPSEIVDAAGRRVVFEEGRIRLGEDEVLHYARQRQGMPLGDLDRTERQRAVLVGLLDGLQERLTEDPGSTLELLSLLRDDVQLDGGGLEDLLVLAPLLPGLDPEDAHSLMVPISGFDTIDGQSANIVDRERTAALGRALREDDLAGYVEQYGTGYTP